VRRKVFVIMATALTGQVTLGCDISGTPRAVLPAGVSPAPPGYRSPDWRAGRPSFFASGFQSWTKAFLSLVALLSKGIEAA
jgi:hypothetical protein